MELLAQFNGVVLSRYYMVVIFLSIFLSSMLLHFCIFIERKYRSWIVQQIQMAHAMLALRREWMWLRLKAAIRPSYFKKETSFMKGKKLQNTGTWQSLSGWECQCSVYQLGFLMNLMHLQIPWAFPISISNVFGYLKGTI